MRQKIVLASSNPGKIREIKTILSRCEIIPQAALNIIDAEETGTTFVENAIIKARNAARSSGLAAIADDSGLEVDALNGEPGVYSARYAGVQSDDNANLEKVLSMMADVPDDQRSARFHCVIAYMRHANDPCPIIAQGSWEGTMLRQSQGENGFGYDPIFFLPEYGCSSAELSGDEKNRISHRSQALEKLVQQLETTQLSDTR